MKIAIACDHGALALKNNLRDYLTGKGIDAQWKCYGSEDTPEVAHVFHVNIILDEAKRCNDDSAEFFRQHV